MNEIQTQRYRLRRRKVNTKVKFPDNFPPLLCRLYASRGINDVNELDRSIKGMLPWKGLSGIEKAVNVLYKALLEENRIIIVGDFDADGATSTALTILSLKSLGFSNIDYLVPNRFENGYGLSQDIVDQAYAFGAQLIMTVDNGISSHSGVDYSNNLGIRVLITDHHLPHGTLPNAEAIINPNLYNSDFPSKSLAGVGVVFYLMLALRAFLKENGWFEETGIKIPNLAEYLDLVALGTVVDVVPLDTNNRILIWQGINRIRAGKCCFGIKALFKIAERNYQGITENDLSFIIGPRLNAAGRLRDMSIGVELLLSENFSDAQVFANELNILNQTRRKIEKEMETKACVVLLKNFKNNNKNKLPNGLALYHSDWHQGIIGVLASRIKERFHRPVIAFAPAIDGGIIKGSGRSIQGIDIYSILQKIDILYPKIMIEFGGHSMAVGISMKRSHFNEFQYYFNEFVTEYLDPFFLQKEVISDGSLIPSEMTIKMAQILRNAGPWGHMFPEPLFDGHFYILKQYLINEQHLKVIVRPVEGGPILNGIMFNVDTACWPNSDIHLAEIIYKLDINEFYGKRSLQIIIDNIWSI